MLGGKRKQPVVFLGSSYTPVDIQESCARGLSSCSIYQLSTINRMIILQRCVSPHKHSQDGQRIVRPSS